MGQSVVSTGVGGQTARAVLLAPTGDFGSRLLPKCSRAVLHRSIQTGCFVPPVHPRLGKRSVGRWSGEQWQWVATCVGGEELAEVVVERAVL